MTTQPTESVLDLSFSQRSCAHTQCAIRYKVVSNGIRQFVEQCESCGEVSNFLKKSDPRVVQAADIQPVDTTLRTQQRHAHWAQIRQEQAARQAHYQEEWWARYNQYLESPQWQEKRQLALKRDAFLCQSCRKNRASQVHHLSYQHLGAEPLWELVSICKRCHDQLTAMDRRQRQG